MERGNIMAAEFFDGLVKTISKTTKVINRTDKKTEVTDEIINVLGYGDEAKGKDGKGCDYTILVGEDMKQYGIQ